MKDSLQGLFGYLRGFVGRRETTSAPTPPTKERRNTERRTRPRMHIAAGREGLPTNLFVMIGDHRCALRDLSAYGFCAELPLELDGLVAGSTFQATIAIGSNCIELNARVANRYEMRIGCQITDVTGPWDDTIAQILNPHRLGEALREIDPRFVTQHDTLTTRWFQGGSACNLFIWSEPQGRIRCAQLFFLSHVAEWSHDKGVRTGTVTAPPDASLSYGRSDSFGLKSPPNPETLLMARRILAAAKIEHSVRALFR